MDEDRNYLETTIFIREGFEQTMMSEKMSEKMLSSRDLIVDGEDGRTKFLVESTAFTNLEKERLLRLQQYMIKFQNINSARAADILDIQQKTASRLLAKAEKNNFLESEGKTKNKIYRLIS